MATLGELAKLIRSKNAGPFNLTFDIMFETEDAYRRVVGSNAVTKGVIRRLYQVPEEKILLVHHDAARAIKVSIPRPVPSCDLEDGDCYGGQQYGPLVDLEIPGA
ncbi:MAG: DUF4387 domain-containing protein [Candidatus Tectomicrobia bacterium]|nr:DUF4387 domain-containing protein [Candidatus Tectomicrobia bacterium]